MDKREAEDFIYKSYLKAQQYQNYNAKDSQKRRNDLTYELLRKKTGTPCVIITGSKGKGSTASMISQILQSEYTVGLMTSPHIVDFCERFQVNGGKISDEDFVKQILMIREKIEAIDTSIPKDVCISPMGIQAYLALNYFESRKTQFNVFECGKGAKYDDVNNIRHDYAVINSIFLEHTRELGETIEEIAEDKAHVITREQKCIYVAEQNPSVLKIIQNRAKCLNVPVKIYGRDFRADNIRYTKDGMIFDVIIGQDVYSDITIPLLGQHQAKNCALALALCKDVLGNKNFFEDKDRFGKQKFLEEKDELEKQNLSERKDGTEKQNLSERKDGTEKQKLSKEKEGLEKQKFPEEKDELEKQNLWEEKDKLGKEKLSKEKDKSERENLFEKKIWNIFKIKDNLAKLNWPGRMEVVSKEPFVLLDACINKASCENVLKVLDYLNISKATVIVGIPDDKDYIGVVKTMERKASSIILTKSQNPHYVFTRRQQEKLQAEGIRAEWTDSISEAMDLAVKKEQEIIILGTTSVVAEVKKIKL